MSLPSRSRQGQGSPPPGTRTLVQLRNVHKTYLLGTEGVPALRGVSLTVAAGEFIVILGKSGGGKSTVSDACEAPCGRERSDMPQNWPADADAEHHGHH